MGRECAMEAGTILSMGPQQPANPHAHPASRTKLQHAAETADGPGLASAATRLGGSDVCVQAAAEVDVVSGRAGRARPYGVCTCIPSVDRHLRW